MFYDKAKNDPYKSMPIIENTISVKLVVILKRYIVVYCACLSEKDNILFRFILLVI
jgi:hypothetical protein